MVGINLRMRSNGLKNIIISVIWIISGFGAMWLNNIVIVEEQARTIFAFFTTLYIALGVIVLMLSILDVDKKVVKRKCLPKKNLK